MTAAMIMAGVACVVLAALAIVQILVASGRPYGQFVWGGRHEVLPTRLHIGSVIAIALYAGFALVLLSRSGALQGGATKFIIVSTWVLFAYFTLGILMNAISRSFAERVTMTPVSAVLAGSALVIAVTA